MSYEKIVRRPDPRRTDSWCQQGVAHDHGACGPLWNSVDARDMEEALIWASAKARPVVLSLPEVPDELRGAGALIGGNTGDRYEWQPGGIWEVVNRPIRWRGLLGAILDREGGSVTVEPASPTN